MDVRAPLARIALVVNVCQGSARPVVLGKGWATGTARRGAESKINLHWLSRIEIGARSTSCFLVFAYMYLS
jgi:hypothetical protein